MFAKYLDTEQIAAIREVNAAVINISGRQRMLSQRIALFALKLACTGVSVASPEENRDRQKNLQRELIEMLNLMESSHNGLIYGNADLKLPEHLSPEIAAIYFAPPWHLDRQIRNFIEAGRRFLQVPLSELTRENEDLQAILTASDRHLLEALDKVVSQYQEERERRDLMFSRYQVELYQKSRKAASMERARSRELEKAIEQLKKMQLQLVQAEKMSSLGQLVAGVAHEINNPVHFLNGNLGYAMDYVSSLMKMLAVYQQHFPLSCSAEIENVAETVELEYVSEDLPKLLASMQTAIDRIKEIVSSLKNFSRLDTGEVQTMDIHAGLETTLLILKYRLKHNACDRIISVIKDYGDLPEVECYGGMLNQVFTNLIGNAIDALEMNCPKDQTPTIWIATRREGSDRISIRIADNAGGMTEDVRKNLFAPFFTTKPIGKGTGLGLSIAYQIIVERHCGMLECNTQLGEGSEFIITIPILQNVRNAPLSPVSMAS